MINLFSSRASASFSLFFSSYRFTFSFSSYNLGIMTFSNFSILPLLSSIVFSSLSILLLKFNCFISQAFIYFCLFLSCSSSLFRLWFSYWIVFLNYLYFSSYSSFFSLLYSFSLLIFSSSSWILFSSFVLWFFVNYRLSFVLAYFDESSSYYFVKDSRDYLVCSS